MNRFLGWNLFHTWNLYIQNVESFPPIESIPYRELSHTRCYVPIVQGQRGFKLIQIDSLAGVDSLPGIDSPTGMDSPLGIYAPK